MFTKKRKQEEEFLRFFRIKGFLRKPNTALEKSKEVRSFCRWHTIGCYQTERQS